MKNIAIIPARGGSKRIPRKNVKPFLGKPVIAYSIQSALRSSLFEEVMVSTDDPEIATIAEQYGATVPFMRSAANADDHATLADVLLEVVRKYEEKNVEPENICCILPTAPLIGEKEIRQAFQRFLEGGYDSVCPVVAFSYPILRSLDVDEKGLLKMNWPEYLSTRSQDLRPAYHDTGTFYWVKKEALRKEGKLLTANCSAFIMNELQVQDIDTETDWALAELKYKLLHNA
ncbi:MAG: pseudaminic acid cytidylyltransferase, partial [Tannerellaceae bacterium]|jgi:N-acylneuraminate cytidylyltransferase|nr:pseudaminic acid cytidylyltransferase [Tannerellaceae bacterium]